MLSWLHCFLFLKLMKSNISSSTQRLIPCRAYAYILQDTVHDALKIVRNGSTRVYQSQNGDAPVTVNVDVEVKWEIVAFGQYIIFQLQNKSQGVIFSLINEFHEYISNTGKVHLLIFFLKDFIACFVVHILSFFLLDKLIVSGLFTATEISFISTTTTYQQIIGDRSALP